MEAKMESGSVPAETRINAIVDYEVKKLSKKAIARKWITRGQTPDPGGGTGVGKKAGKISKKPKKTKKNGNSS